MEGGRRSKQLTTVVVGVADGRVLGGPTEAAVWRELKTDELREKADDAEGAHVHRRGTTAFLVAGMQLEELQ
jgi:hypothetical protein